MGNLPCVGEKDEAWKQQNKEMVENPAYKFANIAKGGSLIDAYKSGGPRRVVEIAEQEMSGFLYHKNGGRHRITETEFQRWKWKSSQRAAGLDETQTIPDEKLKAELSTGSGRTFTPHDACWDLQKRGGVGETPFHILCLMDSPVHFEVAKILLKLFPNLALDVYEGEEYYGESALHIAIVIGDFEMVQLLVEAGANVNQRATGRFFLPEDQKKAFNGRSNYEGYAYYGEYPLAFATCLGRMEIYDYLLDHGANPDLQDVFGNSVLHMVVIADQTEMYRYAVRHSKLRASTTVKNNENLTPLALACKLARYSIFKEMLELDSIEFWSFSTTLCSAHPLQTLDSVGPDGSTNWDSALMIIVNGEKDDHLEMLDGGVMRQLLIEKWKTFAKRRFMGNLVFTIIHLVLFSVSIYTRPMGCALLQYRGPVDAVRYTSEIIVSLNCLAKVLYELTQILKQGFSSFFKNCKHAPAQTMYLISCIMVLACVPMRFTCQYVVEDVLVILAAPCSWAFMLFFARGYTLTGPFVTMIYKMIVGDLVRFGIIYVIFLSGFTQAFYFLFKDVTNDTDDVDLNKFANIPETVLKLYQMTFGEFKYDVFNLSHYAPLTKIIFALFMILVPILLLNMLIAMMGNTHTQIITKSTKEWWKQWAKIVVVLERGISKKKRLEYQKAYSVRLAGGPGQGDGSPPTQEQRALVVIRMGSKSRARKRKDAFFRWKALSKEVISQLRHKRYAGQPFQLMESVRKGQLLNEGRPDLVLASTIAQLAWQKDIDLNRNNSFVPEKDSCSYSRQSGDIHQEPLSWSATTTNTLKQVHHSSSSAKGGALSASTLRKRRLLHNKVTPLDSNETSKDTRSNSESSNYLFSNASDSDMSDIVMQNPSAVKEELADTFESTSLSPRFCPTCGRVRSTDTQDRVYPSLLDQYTARTKQDLAREITKSNQGANQNQVTAPSGTEKFPVSRFEICYFNHNVVSHLKHHENGLVTHSQSCILNHHKDCFVNHHEIFDRNHHELCQGVHHDSRKLFHHEDSETFLHNDSQASHQSDNSINHYKSHNFSPEIISLSSGTSEEHTTPGTEMFKANNLRSSRAVLPGIASESTSHWFEHNNIIKFSTKNSRKTEMKQKSSRRRKLNQNILEERNEKLKYFRRKK